MRRGNKNKRKRNIVSRKRKGSPRKSGVRTTLVTGGGGG